MWPAYTVEEKKRTVLQEPKTEDANASVRVAEHEPELEMRRGAFVKSSLPRQWLYLSVTSKAAGEARANLKIWTLS